MDSSEIEEIRSFWDRVAADWDIQVGDDGDSNRILNSDPVVWAFAGEVTGLDVLDAGCGTGYLSRKLHEHGARVTGIDISERMVAVARAKAPHIDFQQRKCIDPPWAHFTSDFIWFHRPLSDYWKSFTRAGFDVVDFEEPRVAESRFHLADTPRKLHNSKTRPYSVAFKLAKRKPDPPPLNRGIRRTPR